MKEVSSKGKDNTPNSLHMNSRVTQDKPIAYAGPKQIVYEGLKVILEGNCNLDQGKIPNQNILYVWSIDQANNNDDDIPHVTLESVEGNPRNSSFRAPYVSFDPSKSDNKTYASLVFKLVVKDTNTGLESDPSWVTVVVKLIQRVLILQGGGSLGAYEVGVYKALCEKLHALDQKNNARKNRPLFDIIAGTSIGALNAALIVNSVKQSMKVKGLKGYNIEIWNKSVVDLEGFWNAITFSIPPFENQFFNSWWNFLHYATTNIRQWSQSYQNIFGQYKSSILSPENNTFNPFYLYLRDDMFTPAADAETARRFFSWLFFPYLVPNRVVTPNFPQPDTKFFTGVPRLARFDNSALAHMAKDQEYWDYENDPIKTEFQKGEPRLLIVAIDIQDATSSVTFDSYLCESKYKDGTRPLAEHIIRYPHGINMNHVRASMSPHTVIDYPWLEDEQDGKAMERKRYFWDGAYLSNTPLREVLHLHRYYWYTLQKAKLEGIDEIGDKRKILANGNVDVYNDSTEIHVPHLEVYIANLYPIVEQEQDNPPIDPDIIQDRELDIRFHDKTRYDIKISEMITDYLILHGQLKNLALKHIGIFEGKNKIQEFEDEYQSILGGLTHSQKRSSNDHPVTNYEHETISAKFKNDRTYKDLIDGRFDVARVTYINRKDDKETIFGKAADFSKETMKMMKESGYYDACYALDTASERTSSQSYRIQK